jgi:transcription elongation GreA/GreB family factor
MRPLARATPLFPNENDPPCTDTIPLKRLPSKRPEPNGREGRAEGDLRENAEYHAQREAMGLLQAKVNKLKGDLSRASIIDPDKIPKDQVSLGATVLVRDLDYQDEEEFTLVGAGDEDYDSGKYLITSPVGQGLLGKRVGERVEIDFEDILGPVYVTDPSVPAGTR